jgi:site-specific recombinase XerD
MFVPLQVGNAKKGIKSDYVFLNERGQPFGRMGIGRMIERAGEAAKLPFPVHVHMLRHSTGYALAARRMDTRCLQRYLGHASITNTVRYTAMSPEPFRDIGISGAETSPSEKSKSRSKLTDPSPLLKYLSH